MDMIGKNSNGPKRFLMNKNCRGCLEKKDFSKFHKNKDSPDGYFNFCKVCRNKKANDKLKERRGSSYIPIERHAKYKSRVYSIWKNMKRRCIDPNSPSYKYYGERGIVVCERWFSSFINFYQDMGEPISKIHSIDRINNDGNYEPGNCRWATPKEQANNKRKAGV
jgi:hypothetical protein